MGRIDYLLQGAFDMHAHGYPQYTYKMRPTDTDYEWAQDAVKAGMGGFVIKSSTWPSMSTAAMLNELFGEQGLKVFGSITLNPIVGGISPLSVECAAEMGAKVIYMPTWGCRNDVKHGCKYGKGMREYIPHMQEIIDGEGLTVLGEDGELTDDAKTIIKICKDYDMILASSHLSIGESLKLAEECHDVGTKFSLTHPLLAPLIDASIEQMQQIAAYGGYIEHVLVGCMPMHARLDPHKIADAIRAVGPEHTVLGSDANEAWNPGSVEMMRMYIETLLRCGISEDDVYLMTHNNAKKLLGIED